MRWLTKVFLAVLLLGSLACSKIWDDHYGLTETTVNQMMWEEISSQEKYSIFVSYMEELELDSLFLAGSSHTLFIPNNDAFASFNPDTGDVAILLRYHILDYVFNMINVDGAKLVQTSTGKFAHTEFYSGQYSFSGSDVEYTSPLYLDGRFYELAEIAYPLPNLYEYISLHTPVLKTYIDEFDSTLLDLEKSKPLGFNEDGEIFYDSVYTIVNYFDTIWFPVNYENRYKTATFLLYTDEEYYAALDEMALSMGEGLTADDIPKVWQDEVLIPELNKTGIFPNSLHYEDFVSGRLKNVQGDSVEVDFANIDPDSRVLCSNGVVFNFYDFKVPEYLYQGEVRIEGEHMVDSLGSGIFFWKPEYTVRGTTDAIAAKPARNISEGASNDSLISLTFPSQPFAGQFEFEFYFNNMFPQNYRFIWGANYRPSGVYEVYANDVQILYFDTFSLRKTVFSYDGQYFYSPINGNNQVDALIDNLTEFGNVKITIKYVGPGSPTLKPLNGFNIDFVSLTPVE